MSFPYLGGIRLLAFGRTPEGWVSCGGSLLPQSMLEKAESLEQLRWIENGYRIRVGVTDIETIGIDTPQDMERARQFLENGKTKKP